MTKISNEFHQRGLAIRNSLRIFETRSIQTRNIGQFFQVSIHSHPCHPQQQAARNSFSTFKQSSKQNQIISFGIQLMRRHLVAFYKVAKQRDNAPLTYKRNFKLYQLITIWPRSTSFNNIISNFPNSQTQMSQGTCTCNPCC